MARRLFLALFQPLFSVSGFQQNCTLPRKHYMIDMLKIVSAHLEVKEMLRLMHINNPCTLCMQHRCQMFTGQVSQVI